MTSAPLCYKRFASNRHPKRFRLSEFVIVEKRFCSHYYQSKIIHKAFIWAYPYPEVEAVPEWLERRRLFVASPGLDWPPRPLERAVSAGWQLKAAAAEVDAAAAESPLDLDRCLGPLRLRDFGPRFDINMHQSIHNPLWTHRYCQAEPSGLLWWASLLGLTCFWCWSWSFPHWSFQPNCRPRPLDQFWNSKNLPLKHTYLILSRGNPAKNRHPEEFNLSNIILQPMKYYHDTTRNLILRNNIWSNMRFRIDSYSSSLWIWVFNMSSHQSTSGLTMWAKYVSISVSSQYKRLQWLSYALNNDSMSSLRRSCVIVIRMMNNCDAIVVWKEFA